MSWEGTNIELASIHSYNHKTRSYDLPPDHSDLGTVYFPLGTVDVSYSLSEVELSLLLGRDTLNLDKGSVGAGVALCPLVR